MEWDDNRILSNFRNLRGGQFDALREDLKIDLSDSQLTAYAVHCALVLHRDPTIGELRIWEHLTRLSPAVGEATLNALETKSRVLAETYADMLAKQRELSPKTLPLSLDAMLSMATNALERGGKERDLRAHDLRLTDLLPAPFAKNGLGEEQSPAFLSLFKKSFPFAPVQSGDLCLMVEQSDGLQYSAWNALLSLLEDDRFQANLRELFVVPKSGLLSALLFRFDGFTVDPSRLTISSSSLSDIFTKEYIGCPVLVLSQSAVTEVLEELDARGAKGTVFAQLTGDKQVTFLGSRPLTEQTEFLLSLLLPCPAVSADLQADSSLTAPVSFQPHDRYFCQFLPFEDGNSQSVDILGLSASSASAPVEEGSFSTAVLTALAPIVSCALCGVEYPEMRLAVDLTTPKADCTELAHEFAAAIGLYRVQAELGIPAAQTKITEKDTATPVLTIFALGKGQKTPAERLTGSGTKVYWLPIALSPDGLPDFAALRDLLSDLALGARHGAIASARIVLQKSPLQILAEMNTDRRVAKPSSSAEELKEPFPLGILLETVYEMPFTQIATVEDCGEPEFEQEQPEQTPKDEIRIPEQYRIPQGNGLIWRPAPEVVILAPEKNPDALALSIYLGNTGASVSIFTPAEKDRFLRAILTASVVYRFPGVKLPEGAKAEFAFSILRENGGVVRNLKKMPRRKKN